MNLNQKIINAALRLIGNNNAIVNAAAEATEPKVYVALLTQLGQDAPVATVLKNTLDIIPSYVYSSTGEYNLTDLDETPFMPLNKTIITFGQTHNNNAFVNMSYFLSDTFLLRLYVNHSVTGDGIDGNMTITPIKIEVYP